MTKGKYLTHESKLQLASLRYLRIIDSNIATLWQRWLVFQESAKSSGLDYEAAWMMFWKQVEQLRRRQAGARTVGKPIRAPSTFVAELAEVENAIKTCLKNDPSKRPTQCKVAEALAVSHGKDVSDASFSEFDGARILRRRLSSLSWDGLVERVWIEFLEMHEPVRN